jgi:hypothetical protein
MSNLHKENLLKYKLQQGILEIGGSSSAQNYRIVSRNVVKSAVKPILCQ